MLEQAIFFIIGISVILFFSAVSYITFRTVLNPVSIILWWWGGWLLMANCSLTGLFLPSWRTNLLISVFLFSYIIGCFIPTAFHKRNYKLSSLKISNHIAIEKTNENYARIKKLGKFFSVCLMVVIPFMLYYAYVSVNAMLSYGPGYRMLIISSFHSAGVLFPSKFIAYFFRVVVASITYAYSFYAVSTFLFNRNYKVIFISFVLVILQSAIYFSRSDIYLILVVMLVAYFTFDSSFISKNSNVLRAKASLRKYFFFLFSVLLIITILRAGHSKIYELIRIYGIDYHTVGFVLLDQELSDPDSILHTQRTYGLSAVGGVERVVVTFLRRTDPNIHSIVFDNRAKHWAFTLTGFEPDGREKRYNALYNIVYGLYRDFGVVSVIVGGFLIGFICSRAFIRWVMKGNICDYMMFILLCVGLMMHSLLSSQLESTPLWFSIILFFFYKKVRIYKKSVRDTQVWHGKN